MVMMSRNVLNTIPKEKGKGWSVTDPVVLYGVDEYSPKVHEQQGEPVTDASVRHMQYSLVEILIQNMIDCA